MLESVPMENKNRITDLLIKFQNNDGSWGYYPDDPGLIEPTVYAILSLFPEKEEQVQRGLEWILNQQQDDGSFIHFDRNAVWPTFLVSLLLSVLDKKGSLPGKSALDWIIKHKGSSIPYSQQWDQQELTTAAGWPWFQNTTCWVEPTSYALIALKHNKISNNRAKQRIQSAEQFLLSRICRGGGWNVGNARLLNVELSFYPTCTAFALLALQDHGDDIPVLEGLYALVDFLGTTISSYHVALGIVVLHCFGEKRGKMTKKLSEIGKETVWDSQYIPALAFSRIAFGVDSYNPLKFKE